MRRFLVSSNKPSDPPPSSAPKSTETSSKPAATVSDPATEQVNKATPANVVKSTSPITGSFSDRLRSVPLPSDLAASLTWGAGEAVPYAALVATFEEVAQKPGRLDKESALKRFFMQVLCTSPQHLEAAVYLSFNQVLPVYEGLELGVGDSLLIKAIGEATGRKKDAIEEDYEREGDLGLVSLLSRQAQRTL
eukprot:gene42440-51846_t